MKLTVHIILNSHLDPVWLWTKPQGIDEVLGTARTACELIESNPDIHITRGEAWFYDVVRRFEPRIFARIRRHVAGGRWHIVGGWWIQPDCNLPSAEGFRRQGAVGQRFFQKYFGQSARTGYNVDSFGHAATLPDFYAAAGMSQYVMMRPQVQEKTLPANLFTWESPSGSRMTTFRISQSYCTGRAPGQMEGNLKASIADADRRVGHTMCFVGVGDHGGGPIQEEIDWVRAHAAYAADVELVFSHPDAFFEAVRNSKSELPVVRGELQMHAVGCYTVVHAIKQGLRQAEDLATQAENLVARPVVRVADRKRMAGRLDEAWRHILFNHFHDILAGSSIRSSYDWAGDELGAARTVCRDAIVDVMRQMLRRLAPCARQQLLLVNASPAEFAGYVEIEPWIGYRLWSPTETKDDVLLADEEGRHVPVQRIKAEAAMPMVRLLTWVSIPASGQRVLRVAFGRQEEISAGVTWHDGVLSNNAGIAVSPGTEGIASLGLGSPAPWVAGAGIRVAVLHDRSDTWSHGIDAFREGSAGLFTASGTWCVHEQGPLRVTLKQEMTFDRSRLLWRVLLDKDERVLRLRLRLTWNDQAKVVKLTVPLAFPVSRRVDGCPGGTLERACDGKEYPFHNFTALTDGANAGLALVSRDVFGIDVAADGTVGLTLLRCPLFANDASLTVTPEDCFPVTDQGVHEYEIAILPFDGQDFSRIEAEMRRQKQPVWMAETTRGMPRQLAPGAKPPASPKKRPNILLLFSDQHNASVLGCEGHPDVMTQTLTNWRPRVFGFPVPIVRTASAFRRASRS